MVNTPDFIVKLMLRSSSSKAGTELNPKPNPHKAGGGRSEFGRTYLTGFRTRGGEKVFLVFDNAGLRGVRRNLSWRLQSISCPF